MLWITFLCFVQSPEAQFKSYLEQELSSRYEMYTIKRMMVPPIRLEKNQSLTFQPRKNTRWVGTLILDAMVHKQNGSVKTYIAQAQVEVYMEVPTAQSDIPRHTPLEQADIAWEGSWVKQPHRVPLEESDIEGRRSKSFLRAGTSILPQFTERTPLVERNQTVKVTLENGPVRIQLLAKALDSGANSETIRVKNDQGKLLRAIVTGPGLARVVIPNQGDYP